MDHLSGRSSNKENTQYTPNFDERLDHGAPLSGDMVRTRGCLRSHEDDLAELRRENFRLRLRCYDYEKLYKESTNPQDFDSSRLFSAKAENVALKEAITEKHSLLNAASKMIDALKEENDMFEVQIRDLKERFDANEKEWRCKYDMLYQELEQSKSLIRTHELQLLTRENEAMRQQNDLRSRIAELEVDLESAKADMDRKQLELEAFQLEAKELRLTLEQVEQDRPRLADAQAAAQQLCDCMSATCQKRVEEVTSIVHILVKQIRDAGFTPHANLPMELSGEKECNACVPLTEQTNVSELNRSNTAPGEDRVDSDMTEAGGDSNTRVAYLSQRLNAARQLLLEIGNEKLRQDKVISRLQALSEREQKTLQEECRSVREQLEKQKQLHAVELTRRDDEIQRLNQRVTELVREIDSLTVLRGSLMSEVDKAREQISRLQWEHADVCGKLNKELREKQCVIQHLQIALSTVEVGDVTQFPLPVEAYLHDTSVAPDGSAICADSLGTTKESNVKMNMSGNHALVLRKQLLSLSHQVTETHTTEPEEDSVELEPKPGVGLSEVHVGIVKKLRSQRETSETYSLEVAEPFQEIAADSQGSRTDKSLNNSVSLASDHITSIDLTKDVAQLSTCSSAVDSFADLPTVSTPPNVTDSPEYANVTELDDIAAPNRSLNADPVGQSHQRGMTRKKAPLTSSGIIHSASIDPLGESPNKCAGSNTSGDTDHSHQLPIRSPPRSQPVCEIRELYQLIHNLMLQIDNIRVTEHSFVEMVNRSLSTAGINASFQISPQRTKASLFVKSIPDAVSYASSGAPDVHQPCNNNSAELPLSQHSKANATYGGVETLLDDPDSHSYQPVRPADRSYLSTSGFNTTVAELRACPASPIMHNLQSDDDGDDAQSRPQSHSGPTVRPSRLPKARGKPSNLIGSASVCEDTNTQAPPTSRTQPLSVSFTIGDEEDNRLKRLVAPQHSAVGDLTMVEWQNRDLFERLSQATARLRNALEECFDVSSELWTGDVSQRLFRLLSTHQLNVSQPGDSVDNHSHQSVVDADEKTPEAIKQIPGVDFSMACLTQNRSVRFDGAQPLPPTLEPITPDFGLSQLYGSAWRSRDSMKPTQPEFEDAVEETTPKQPTEFKPDFSILQRFVCLLTQALANVKAVASAPALDDAASHEDGDGLPAVDWLTSWVESASHWFQSYLDAMQCPVSVRRDSNQSKEASQMDVHHMESMLECLERVYHDRVERLSLHMKHPGTDPRADSSRLDVLAASECVDGKTPSKEVVSYHRRDGTVSFDHLLVDQDRCAQTSCETRPVKLNQLNSSQPNLSLSHEHSARHLEDLSSLAEQLSNAQDTISRLEQELRKQKLEYAEQLKTTVPKHDYDQLHEQFSSLRSEFQVVSDQLGATEDRLEQIEQMVFSEFPEPCEHPLIPAIELIIGEVHELRDVVDQLTEEQQTTYALLQDLVELPESGKTLSNYVEIVRQRWNEMRDDLAREVAEKDEALELMHGMHLTTVHDPNTLLGYVQACFACLTAKQDEINRLGLLCEQTEESLRNTVPLVDYEDLKTELARVEKELGQRKDDLLAMESQLNDVVKSSVPHQTYESKLERLAALEEELAVNQAKHAVYEHERQEVISLVSSKINRQINTDDWVAQIELICDEFVSITQSMTRLQTEYDHVLAECQDLREQVSKTITEMDVNLAQVKQEHEAALATLRDQLNLEFAKKLQAATEEHTVSQTRLTDELEAYRRQHEELSAKLKSQEQKLMDVGQQLHDAERELGHLRESVVAHAEAAKAASETSRAQEQRADELASHLECLRAEHRNCSSRGELVDVQTSPVIVQLPNDDELEAAATLRPASVEMNEARVRKYGELKAVAFEIKEKLIRRTDKLEAALTEVARLRSIIQQDKEHASRVLEEVEDLRKQAVRKNKRIHELETELARLKAAQTVVTQPVCSARNTRSSARTVSEVEQPRGSQCRMGAPRLTKTAAEMLAIISSTNTSLLHCPTTPSIDDPGMDTDTVAQIDLPSLLDPGSTPQPTAAATNMTGTIPDLLKPKEHCEQCDKLHNLVLGMKRLTVELQRRVNVNLREEYSLLATLDAFEAQPSLLPSSAQDTVEQVTCSTRSPKGSNENISLQHSTNTSLEDLRTMVKTLHHTRSRLKHYAQEMDRICGKFIQHWKPSGQLPAASPSQAQDEINTIINRSVELLQRVYRRSKAFFEGLEVTNDVTARELISDVRSVIKMLQLGRESSSTSRYSPSPVPTDEDKENQSVSVEPIGSQLIDNTRDKKRLTVRAERSYRRYRDLAQGLDTMTKELTETNNVLAAARSNLERTAGLSVLSNTTNTRFSKTWPPPEKPDST